MKISQEWRKRIEDSQKLSFYLIGDTKVARVRYGDEAEDWGANEHECHDCGVAKGQSSKMQVITCDCDIDVDSAAEEN